MIRLDLLFSYWLFIWYILYEIEITKYNPKAWLIFALISNSYVIFFMIYFKRFYKLLLFVIAVSIFKVLPLWTLRNTIIYMKDIIAGVVLFFIYYAWLNYNNKNIYILYKQFYISIKYNNLKNTPTMYFLNSLKNKFINNK
jgi:hypothetical protein